MIQQVSEKLEDLTADVAFVCVVFMTSLFCFYPYVVILSIKKLTAAA